MTATLTANRSDSRYAQCIAASKRVRWEIDRDVLRGRGFDFDRPFLPDALSLAPRLAFLTSGERRLYSQIQGRTYANMFGLVERFIGAKILEISSDRWMDDQVALEALVRFTDEELKHQELFRRIEAMMAPGLPESYVFRARPNEVAQAVLAASTWAVLGLTCNIELFTLAHYRASIDREQDIDPLWKDVFLFHWREESQHAILDELEWVREDGRLTPRQRDAAVDDLIALVGAVDGILRVQADADASCLIGAVVRDLAPDEQAAIRATTLAAYREQYILSGARDERFQEVLRALVSDAQLRRVADALGTLVG